MTEPTTANALRLPELAAPSGDRAAQEAAVYAALAEVMDPELGMDVVSLALIKYLDWEGGGLEVGMILTTPFCPYGGEMLSMVKAAAESVTGGPVNVRLLAERWDPAEAGLVW